MTDGKRTRTLKIVALVAVGGFLGANSRYFLAVVWPGLVGTLVANALGSFVLGVVVYEARFTGLLPERLHFLVATGFLSSFTTYSTFVLESAQAPLPLLIGNVVGTYALGFAGVLAGREIAGAFERWTTPSATGGDAD